MKNPLPHNQLPLDEVDTLIVTPHLAGQTDESLRNVGDAALPASGRHLPVTGPITP